MKPQCFALDSEFVLKEGGTRMDDEIVCRCEEILESEIKDAISHGAKNVNEIKRWTRAGMGLCQGRTCGRLIEKILSKECNIPLKDIQPSTYRKPVRPVKMDVRSKND